MNSPTNAFNWTDDTDPLAGARGIIFGVGISLPVWAVIVHVAWRLL